MDKKLSKVIEAAGGPGAVGRALGVTSQAVSQWKIAPPDRCIDLELLVGGIVTRYELRPDVFGPRTLPKISIRKD